MLSFVMEIFPHKELTEMLTTTKLNYIFSLCGAGLGNAATGRHHLLFTQWKFVRAGNNFCAKFFKHSFILYYTMRTSVFVFAENAPERTLQPQR